MKLDCYLTPYTKIKSKWIKDLNVRPETIKLLEENIGSLTLILAMIFRIDTQSKATKAKIHKWDFIKLKSFCTGKKTINKIKRQATEWEKRFANHVQYRVNVENI